ncbi:MAG: class III poly(R)-hydroxyalkanoic acid synthase subunit PhaC [Nitrososphaeraceae archaeon]
MNLVSTNIDNKLNKKDDSIEVVFKDLSRKLSKTCDVLNDIERASVGNTKSRIIYENEIYRLLHYEPVFKNPMKIPVLIVYALINRSYILDLQSNKSWVKNLVDQGFDVYLIDWKDPPYTSKYISFDDYVNYYIDDCVDMIRNNHSVDQITLHGYCMGSTMSAMYCSLNKHKIKNLITLAPVINTEKDSTIIGNFARTMNADKILDSIGNLSTDILYSCFSTLKPFKQGFNKYINLVENIDNTKFVDNFLKIERWLYDTPPISGETFKQWVVDIYQQNLLYHNKFRLGNKRIDLKKIDIPVLNIVANEDHLVSPECSTSFNDVISTEDKTLLRFPTGHVGLIASSYSQKNVLPRVGRWLRKRSS